MYSFLSMEHYAGAMSTHLKCTHLIWPGQEALPKCGPFFKPFKVNSFYPTMFFLLAQGDLLMSMDKKTVRRENIGGFQLVDLIIRELKNHMICYKFSPLIG